MIYHLTCHISYYNSVFEFSLDYLYTPPSVIDTNMDEDEDDGEWIEISESSQDMNGDGSTCNGHINGYVVTMSSYVMACWMMPVTSSRMRLHAMFSLPNALTCVSHTISLLQLVRRSYLIM